LQKKPLEWKLLDKFVLLPWKHMETLFPLL
jgi:hypothetical protein